MLISALVLLLTFIISMTALLINESEESKEKDIIIRNDFNQATKEDLENIKKEIIQSVSHEFVVNRYLNK